MLLTIYFPLLHTSGHLAADDTYSSIQVMPIRKATLKRHDAGAGSKHFIKVVILCEVPVK